MFGSDGPGGESGGPGAGSGGPGGGSGGPGRFETLISYKRFLIKGHMVYYRVLFCTAEYSPVLQTTTLHYRLLFCTTEYYSVVQGLVCTTGY